MEFDGGRPGYRVSGGAYTAGLRQCPLPATQCRRRPEAPTGGTGVPVGAGGVRLCMPLLAVPPHYLVGLPGRHNGLPTGSVGVAKDRAGKGLGSKC